MDPEQEARVKAEARAYALSSSTSSKLLKRKLASAPPICHQTHPAIPGPQVKGTSVGIRRFERPQKMQKVEIVPPFQAAASFVPPGRSTGGHGNDDDDDYVRFVKSLGLDDSIFGPMDNDDEEFHLSDIEEDDDDEEDDTGICIGMNMAMDTEPSTQALSSSLSLPPKDFNGVEAHINRSLEEELGSLLEEDMEAAVHSLMTSKKATAGSPTHRAGSESPKSSKDCAINSKETPAFIAVSNSSPATPLRESARQGTKTHVTYKQSRQLRRLLIRHYQLLVQQAVLAGRAAQLQKIQKEKSDFLSGENSDDLAEILDGAVGMLQDLDQNRKDAIRNSIQMVSSENGIKGRRSLLPKFKDDSELKDGVFTEGERRLTRSIFSKTLEQNILTGPRRTAFDVPGLVNLKRTFSTIDQSVDGTKTDIDILDMESHSEACRQVLKQASASLDNDLIPGTRDLSENFCEAKEFFGDDFRAPCSEEQDFFLRRNRNLFTSGEDNLVLRGVNLYGEKQWILIADRYLPDRSVNIISQRYSKLCVMLYKANGIYIDSKGNLETPPKLESVDDIDDVRVKGLNLTTVQPPAILNVHRWSLEEDLTLLKAVPIMGHMWAELGARLIPHRDRGHLRKRYQVLERRVKATVTRCSKTEQLVYKATGQTISGNGTSLKAAAMLSNGPTKEPPMSIEKAAASLTFLRPSPSKPQTGLHVSLGDEDEKPLSASQVPRAAFGGLHDPHSLRSHSTSGIPGPTMPSIRSERDDIDFTEMASSRAAFERLVEGTNDEWSQFSRMKRILDKDLGNQVCNEGAGQPPMSQCPIITSAPSASSLPCSSTENTVKPQSIGRSAKLHSISREADKRNVGSSHDGTVETAEARNSAVVDGSLGTCNVESPPSTSFQPETPKRSNFFSTEGTPTILSPGFRLSPGLTRHGGTLSLTPSHTFSPAPNSMLQLLESSNDTLGIGDFHAADGSDRAMESVRNDPGLPPLAPSKNSLMMDEFDAIEAISALNSMSNSPFRTAVKQDRESVSAHDVSKKSFFATVVGGGKEKDPKTRLQF